MAANYLSFLFVSFLIATPAHAGGGNGGHAHLDIDSVEFRA